jgi:hypothetical protein
MWKNFLIKKDDEEKISKLSVEEQESLKQLVGSQTKYS